jgi:hypothetical protein
VAVVAVVAARVTVLPAPKHSPG